VPRYRCTTNGCSREVFAHTTSRLARPRLVDDTSLSSRQQAGLNLCVRRRRHDVLAASTTTPPRPRRSYQRRADLEALRRNTRGFGNLSHYRIRSLLHCDKLAR
jgi:hypothetical protein